MASSATAVSHLASEYVAHFDESQVSKSAAAILAAATGAGGAV